MALTYRHPHNERMNTNTNMITAREIRRRNAIRLVEEYFGGKRIRFAEALGLGSGYVSRILAPDASGSRGIGDILARRMEEACGKPQGWMDHEHKVVSVTVNEQARFGKASVSQAKGESPARWIPVIGNIDAGNGGGITIDRAADNDGEWFATSDARAYGFRVMSDRFYPRYQHGECIVFSPGAPLLDGDDVHVEFSNGDQALMRMAWRRESTVQLLPLYSGTTPRPMTVDTDQIDALSRVVGVLCVSTRGG